MADTRGGALLLAAAMIGLAAVFVWREPSRPPPRPVPLPPAVPPSPSAPRRSIAVLGFRNVAGRPEAAWLSTAFAEMLTTELAAGEQLRTIPGENIARMKIELALADADTYAPDTLGRIRDRLGSDLVVFGSYVTIGGPAPARSGWTRGCRTRGTGGTIAQVSETGTESEVLTMVSRTADACGSG